MGGAELPLGRGNVETLRRNDMVQIQVSKSWYISYNHFCMKIDRLSKVGFPAYLVQRRALSRAFSQEKRAKRGQEPLDFAAAPHE